MILFSRKQNEETHQLSDVSEQFFEMQNNDLATGNFEGQNINGASTSNQEHPDSATGNMEGTHEASQQLVEEQRNDFTPSYKKEDADLSTGSIDFSLSRGGNFDLFSNECVGSGYIISLMGQTG